MAKDGRLVDAAVEARSQALLNVVGDLVAEILSLLLCGYVLFFLFPKTNSSLLVYVFYTLLTVVAAVITYKSFSAWREYRHGTWEIKVYYVVDLCERKRGYSVTLAEQYWARDLWKDAIRIQYADNRKTLKKWSDILGPRDTQEDLTLAGLSEEEADWILEQTDVKTHKAMLSHRYVERQGLGQGSLLYWEICNNKPMKYPKVIIGMVGA